MSGLADVATSKTKRRVLLRCLDCPAQFEVRVGKVRCAPCAYEHYAASKRRRYAARKVKP